MIAGRCTPATIEAVSEAGGSEAILEAISEAVIKPIIASTIAVGEEEVTTFAFNPEATGGGEEASTINGAHFNVTTTSIIEVMKVHLTYVERDYLDFVLFIF